MAFGAAKVGDELVDSSTGATARVGACVMRADHSLFILTTAKVSGPQSIAALAQSGRPLGRAVEVEFASEQLSGLSPIGEALGILQVPLDVPVFPGLGGSSAFISVADPIDILGEWVFNVSRPGTVPARLTSVGMPLHIRHRDTSAVSHFAGGLRVAVDDKRGEFSKQGDAGGAVITEPGALVGFILSAGPGRAFLAPAKKVFEVFGVGLATVEAIERHNRNTVRNSPISGYQVTQPVETRDWSTLENFAERLADSSPLFPALLQSTHG